MKWQKQVCLFVRALDSVGVALSVWLVITTFLEADFWHFTDPGTTGVSVSGLMALFFSASVTPVVLGWKRLRMLKVGPGLTYILKIISALLLLISSLPQLNLYPFARTGILGFGIAILPFIFFWVLSQPPFELSNKYLTILTCLDEACSPNFTSKISTNDASLKDFKEKESKPITKLDCFFDVKILVAILTSMSIRYCTGSINVFYENWRYSLGLFVFISVMALISFYEMRKKQAEFRKPSVRPTSLHEWNSSTYYKTNITEENITGESGNASITSPYKLKYSNRKHIIIGLVGCIEGIVFGYLFVFFAWLFSSPSLFTRWSRLNPYPNGNFVLLSLMFGVFASITFRPKKLCMLLLMLSERDHTLSHQKRKLRKIEFMSGFALLLVFLLSLAAELQMEEKFSGSVCLCLVLPYYFSINVQTMSWIVEFIDSSKSSFMSVLPGLFGFIASVTFILTHTVLVLFIVPQLSLLFLGRMEIFFIFLVVIECIAVAAFFFIFEIFHRPCDINRNQIFNTCSSSQYSSFTKFQKYIPNQWFNFGLVALLLPIAAISIGPQFTSDHCPSLHDEAIANISKTLPRNNNTSNSFSVLSWNLLLAHNIYGRDNLPCVGKVLEKLQPDIVGLQESDALPPFWGGKDIIGYLSGYLGRNTSAYYGVEPLRSSLGVGALTSFQVTNRQSYILPQDESKKLPNYSLLNIDCIIKTHPIRIFIVHAVFKNWSATPENPSPMGELSLKQMQFIASKAKNTTPTESIIVMGDFNLNTNEKQLDIFYDMGFKNAPYETRNLTSPSSITNRFAVLDHIFYKGLTKIEGRLITETAVISDHHPVMASFKIQAANKTEKGFCISC